jgi:serine palmitoyltransferase
VFHGLGTIDIQRELELRLAQFLGVESSIVFGMGFATNSTNIPTLAGKGCLIISDEYNHASIILGSKKSGASVAVFKHNGMNALLLTVVPVFPRQFTDNTVIKHYFCVSKT